MRQLLPPGEDSGDPGFSPDLAALYAYPDGQWLRANMVASADGAATLGGVTRQLSSDADRQVFALLRALSDVILVGAATARAERYKPARVREPWRHLREGRAPTPPIAVVTRRLDLDPAAPLINAAPPHARTIIITTAHAPRGLRAELARHADVIVAGQESVDFKAAVSALAERGHRRMLAEGGPHLLAQLLEAGLMDELCLTIGPLMAGPGASRIVAGALPAAEPLPLRLAHVLEDNGYLFCRYTKQHHLSERTVVRDSGQAGSPILSRWPHQYHLHQLPRPFRHHAPGLPHASHAYRAGQIVDRNLGSNEVSVHDDRFQGRGSRPRSKPVATAAARSLTPSLA